MVGSVLTCTIFHIIFNLFFRADLIYRRIKLKPLRVYIMLQTISFIGALVIFFTNIEKSMISAFVAGISCFLVSFQKKNPIKK